MRNSENRRSLDPKIFSPVAVERGSGDDGLLLIDKLPQRTMSMASDGIYSEKSDDNSSRGSGEDPDNEIRSSGGGDVVLTELDKKVQETTKLLQRNCNCLNGRCSKLTVRKMGEGKYNIAGRNVFVRVS